MRLTRDRVLTAAIRLADQSGLAALSMRKLAAELDVEAMSLYNHVKNKEDLLDGVADLVMGEMDRPVAGGQWRAEMHRRAASVYEVLRRHWWAVDLIASRQTPGPAHLAHYDATIGCLHAAGFPYLLAGHACSAMDSHVFGFTIRRRDLPFDPDKLAEWAEHNLPQISVERYPHVHDIAEKIVSDEYRDAGFEFGLELILDGLEKVLATVTRE
ncbi:TetR/AcrR family transcriptional regulator [Streptomyces coffeae]|uniref:TetR/AcrR family transcriptional regulator C-terminal domain-containing protein n=1 Tax=Streptomyces coffeae TaxID=621382 RepID=A0ABS1NE48_9ACTN|nr:TetR/AcrR family transcriptional regulator [Streptomyces coffeae]MBL1098326.1 TetR/AcrR family transcriptional regulator C-terminal domain-containing protein [Streptomyces coffeae]